MPGSSRPSCFRPTVSAAYRRRSARRTASADGDGARLLLLGGEPLGERIEMWWNFVARDEDEITEAWRAWRDRTDRFGEVASPLSRIEAPRPIWLAGGA